MKKRKLIYPIFIGLLSSIIAFSISHYFGAVATFCFDFGMLFGGGVMIGDILLEDWYLHRQIKKGFR